MASFENCYPFMLANEDYTPPRYETVEDCGAQAISGINSASFPLQFAKIAALPPDERGPEVESFYRGAFWNLYAAQIASDEVAKRWLDMAVNGGEGTSTRLLQQAANSFYKDYPVSVDGELGPKTVSAVNAANPLTLVPAFQNARVAHYKAIVLVNPAKAKYLDQWIARAMK